MTIDLSLVHDIIRRILKESRIDKCEDTLCKERAVHDALKAIYILCKDQPRAYVQITGVKKDSQLYDVIEVMNQPECQAVVFLLPELVQVISEETTS